VEARTLICEGRLVATAELADTYGYDTDAYDHVFLFRRGGGYELLVIDRTERYQDDGDLASASERVDVSFAPNTAALADMVDARWPSVSGAWWQLLESGRHNDAELHAAWVPERMRRDLDASSTYDKSLATQSGYFGATSLPAEGRGAPAWRDKAVADMAANLADLGWKVRPGPELSPDVEAGGILSTGTVVAGSLWASRFGQEAAVIVRVDDCGEIYARLADPDDLLDASTMNVVRDGARPPGAPADEGLQHVGHAIDELLQSLQAPASGMGFEL
jgi:hypothetical protein